MRTRFIAAVVLGVVAMTPLAAATAAESPIEPLALRDGVCSDGEFCLYKHSNRGKPVIDWTTGGDDNAYSNNVWPIEGGAVNNQASSAWNRSDCAVRIYRDANQNGAGYTLQPGAAINLSNTPVGNDQAGSHDACV